jgi:hypothetical protein
MIATDACAVRPRRSRALLPWAAFAAMFAAIALTANRGLEMSDEAFYLFAITDPALFKASIHPFGALLHPVWQMLERSIVWLRLFGLCLIAGSAATLGVYLRRYYRRVCGRALSFDPVAGAGCFGLAYYADMSILTPSYNLLANSAACLILAGVLGWRVQDRPGEGAPAGAGIAPSLLVGFGGCLAFFGKPTFAALAAVAVAAILMRDARRGAAREALRRTAIAASACLVPLVVIVAAGVGVAVFVDSLGEGLRVIRFGNDLASLPLKTLGEVLGMPKPLFATLLLLAAIAVWRRRGGGGGRLRTALRVAACVVLLYDAGYLAGHVALLLDYGNPVWFLMSMPTFCVIAGLLAVGLVFADPAAARGRDLLPIAILLCLPFAIAFGSGNNILMQIAVSIFTYLLAGALVAELLLPRRVAAALQALLIAYAAALLLWTAQRPYRLPAPIWEQTQPIAFGPAHDRLYVDATTRRFVETLHAAARRERLAASTPIIDLTGKVPGAALLLNGNAPYFPWVLGLYGQGSIDLANAIWRSLDPQARRGAWIILPADPVFAHSEPMQAFIQNRDRYRLAARLPNLSDRGGRPIEIWVPDAGI